MRRAVLAALGVGLLAACNQIFGIDLGNLVEGGIDASDDTQPQESGADAGVPDAPPDAAPDTQPVWVFTSTTFTPPAEVVIVTPGSPTATPIGHMSLPTGDALVYGSGGRAFVLDRTDGIVFLLDKQDPANLSKLVTIDTKSGNPYAVIVADETHAYIVTYDTNMLQVADLTAIDAGNVTPYAKIDLSAFLASGDTDGFVDMVDGIYDATNHRVYVVLERINRSNVGCTGGALVVGIDPTTNKVFDKNGNSIVDIGDAITLNVQNPLQAHLDTANDRMLVVGNGCTSDAGFIGAGVDEVNLTSLAVTSRLNVSASSYLTAPQSLLYVNTSTAFVLTDHWRRWDTTQTTLGADAGFIPNSPLVDTSSLIIGLANDADGGTPSWGVYSFNTNGLISNEALPKVFNNVEATSIYGLSSALIQ